MIWTFILGLIAGWAAPGAEERLKPLVEQYLPGQPTTPVELRGMSLALCLFAAAIVAAIVAALSGAGGAIFLTLGGVVGVLGPRLYAKFRAMRAPDYD